MAQSHLGQVGAHCSAKTGTEDCSQEAQCQNNICSCRNGRTTYPACNPAPGGKKCSPACPKLQYCDANLNECMCSNGGSTLTGCCTQKCSKYQTCVDGKCKCKFGEFKRHGLVKCRKHVELCAGGCNTDQFCKKTDNGNKCFCGETGKEGKCQKSASLSEMPIKPVIRTCHVGWKQFQGCCYIFREAIKKLEWQEAENNCKLMKITLGFHGAPTPHLTSILSKPENDFIRSLVPKNMWIWIGGKRPLGGPPTWSWSDGSPWAFTNWIAKKPVLNRNDIFIYLQQYDGGWINVNSLNSPTSYVCKYCLQPPVLPHVQP